MKITNECNMELMARYEDNHFDLAIVDPPYGIGASNMTMGKGKNKKWDKKSWDNETPNDEYFVELFRVSKNQIIWGGNYFSLPLTSGWLFWDKERGKNVSFADGELAWASCSNVLRKISCRYDGFIGADYDGRIHPTQKPIKLYEWLLMNYAKEGDKILDTHLGSGSIAIASHNLGYDLTACELDKEYYEASMKRLKEHTSQLRII
jgi:site-specific DNA-methyltransferase (adenine-specific)